MFWPTPVWEARGEVSFPENQSVLRAKYGREVVSGRPAEESRGLRFWSAGWKLWS